MSRRFRGAALLLTLIASLAVPAAAFAHDGEIIAQGSNVIGQVTGGPDGRVHATIQNLGDCPTGTSNCWVEYKWYDKGTSPFDCCFSQRADWGKVPVGQDFIPTWCDHGNHFWELHLRLHWMSSGPTTIQTWGETEYYVNSSGGGTYGATPKYEFNVNVGAGFKGNDGRSFVIQTQTGIDQYSNEAMVATSGGNWITTNGC
jgi:hypothetical protein